jgi:hypothetical protein
MENLGLPVVGSITEKLAALNTKSVAVGKQDGASTTAPKIGVSNETDNNTAELNIPGVDVSAALNC